MAKRNHKAEDHERLIQNVFTMLLLNAQRRNAELERELAPLREIAKSEVGRQLLDEELRRRDDEYYAELALIKKKYAHLREPSSD